METKAAASRFVHEDFTPSHKWVREEGINTLVVELPEFKKEQIRVELDNFGNLIISGERLLADNRWRRFRSVFPLPNNFNEFHTKFENGRLYVKILVFSKPMQPLVNVIVAVVLLLVMALYVTSRN